MVLGVGRYRRLGTTLDDALGEAFDKAAKMLGLGFPGGPAVERAARAGDPTRFALPRPMLGQPGCNFSFSGPQDRAAPDHRAARAGARSSRRSLNDLCASFQAAVGRRPGRPHAPRRRAVPRRATRPAARSVVAGGVAANAYLRACLARLADELDLRLIVPPPALCTDNGVMVAWAGLERLALGLTDDLAAPARARWPLDPAAEPAPGAGVKA